MDNSLDTLCKSIEAEEIDCISPILAIITNPRGIVSLDSPISHYLTFELTCYEGKATVVGESNCLYLADSQHLTVVGRNLLSQFSFSEDFRGYLLVQTKSFTHSIVTKDRFAVSRIYQEPVVSSLDETLCLQYYHFHELLKCVSRRHPSYAEELFRPLFRALFYIFADHERSSAEMTPARNEQITDLFFSLLDNDDTIRLDVDSLSKRLKLSKRSLANAVIKVTGRTPQEYIMKAKVERAKNCISTMGIQSTLTEIAERLGFNSLAAFSRFFKSQTGLTPHEYRNSLLHSGEIVSSGV